MTSASKVTPDNKKTLTFSERIMMFVTSFAFVGLEVAHLNQSKKGFGWCCIVILLTLSFYWIHKMRAGKASPFQKTTLFIFKSILFGTSIFLSYEILKQLFS